MPTTRFLSVSAISVFPVVFCGLAACQRVDDGSGRSPPPLAAPASTPAAAPPAAVALAPATPAVAAIDSSKDAQAAFVRSHYIKFEYQIPMRDGVKLFTSLYIPSDAGPSRKYPLLMQRTPYSVGPYGADRYKTSLANEAFEREGFVFVFQDVRGTHASEGEYVNMRPQKDDKKEPKDIDESTDTYDTLEWLVKHIPENNGKAGLRGVSYPGFYASSGAIDSHPALAATAPQAPIADWFVGDDMHRNGAFNLQMSFGFFYGFDKVRPKPSFSEDWDRFDFETPDAYQFFMDVGPLAEAETRHFKSERPFWKDIVTHPNYDEYWKARNLLPHLRNIKAATLVVGGWFDAEDLYGPLQTYAAIEKQNPDTKNSIVMGPWQHGGWHRGKGEKLGDAEFGFETSKTLQDLELAFFKHHLKGGPDPEIPEALVFETGANRFRRFDAWPPAKAKEKKLFLRTKGGLSFDPPGDGETDNDEFLSDPAKPVPYTQRMQERQAVEYMTEDQRFASRRPDVLVYEGAPLLQDTTLAGPLGVELWVSTTGTDADWIVKVIDENPGVMPGFSKEDDKKGVVNHGGEQLLIRGEPFRGRFRDGFETPKPFVPGEPAKIKFTLNDVFHTFKRGHRIIIQVQSTWFPYIDRCPQTFVPNMFEAKPSDYIKATHRVYRTKDMPSAITMRLLPAEDQ